mmetsp:Transcript_5565/g.12189  ORF Transcript_5565/g.12189 Transcript_5565/m.12189 type:complete len:84 (-) Transcript_5565:2057-2308(-)
MHSACIFRSDMVFRTSISSSWDDMNFHSHQFYHGAPHSFWSALEGCAPTKNIVTNPKYLFLRADIRFDLHFICLISTHRVYSH